MIGKILTAVALVGRIYFHYSALYKSSEKLILLTNITSILPFWADWAESSKEDIDDL